MMDSISLISDIAIRVFLWTVGSLLIYFVLLRCYSAAVRHCWLACSLLLLLVMPLGSIFIERWSILPAIKKAEVVVVESATARPEAIRPEAIISDANVPANLPMPEIQIDEKPSTVDQTNTSSPTVETGLTQPTIKSKRIDFDKIWRDALLVLWGGVSATLLLILGCDLLRLYRVRQQAQLCTDEQVIKVAADCRALLKLSHLPEIRISSNQDAGPIVIGLWRCAIVLPVTSSSWSTERLTAVLLHEFAHVRRRDGLFQCLGAFTCTMHWFNPVAWLLLKRMRLEAERACDDAVLATRMTPVNYADHLLAVASCNRSISWLAPSMAARPSILRTRVQAVLDHSVRRNAVGRIAVVCTLAVIGLIGLPVMLADSKKPDAQTPASIAEKTEPVKPDNLQKADVSLITVSLQTNDKSGQPIPGVSIRGFQTNKRGPITPFAPEFEIKTNDQGQWKGEVPVGNFMVLATKGNLVTPYANGQTWWFLKKTEKQRDIKLILEEGGTVEVQVLNMATKQPVPYVKLILDCGHTSVVDEQGRGKLTAVPMSERTIKAVAAPFADAQVDFNSVGQVHTKVEVLLSPGFEVRGRVTDETGNPIQGAMVEDNYSGSTFLVNMERCITDEQGNYKLGRYNKRSPLWSMSVKHKDYAEKSASNVPQPADDSDVTVMNFVLNEGMELIGFVKNEDGEPIKDASVRFGSSWSLVGVKSDKTDKSGRFEIVKIGVEEFRTVVVEAKGYAPVWQRLRSYKKGGSPVHEFIMKKGITIKGKVVDRDGNPVTGIIISPRAEIDDRPEYVGGRKALDSGGNFEIDSLPETGVSFDVYGSGISDVRRLPWNGENPFVITVDKPGVIIGKVVNAQTREPIQKFKVKLGFPKHAKQEPGEPSASYSAHLSRRGQDVQSEDGKFVIEELISRAGHAVSVTAEGYARAYIDKVLANPADDASWPIEIVMDRGIAISGQLVDEVTNQPVAGAEIYYLGKPQWYSNTIIAGHLAGLDNYTVYDDVNMIRSNPDGKVVFQLDKNTTDYTTLITALGYAPQLIDQQSVAQTQLQVRPMQREAKVDIKNIASIKQQSDRVIVQTKIYHTDQIKVPEDGKVMVDGLPAGRALVAIQNHSGEIIKGAVLLDLVAGETVVADFAQSRHEIHVIVTEQGQPINNAYVSIMAQDLMPKVAANIGSAYTSRDGTVILRNVPAVGKVQVRCDIDGLGQQTQVLDLNDSNRTLSIRFDFDISKTTPSDN